MKHHNKIMKNKILITAFALIIPMQAMAIGFGDVLKNSGSDLVKAGTMSEKDVIEQSRSAVDSIDSANGATPAGSKYSTRMAKIVSRVTMPEIKGVKFNVKVYKSDPKDLNAFATPDGSIRFNSALLDAMTDDQVLAVLGHEIGHVVEKHSFKQIRKSLVASAGVKGAAGQSQVGTAAYNAGGGALAEQFFGASFSRSDELSADAFSLKVLKEADAPLDSMIGALKVLQTAYGNGGGMMSSHPSSPKRIKSYEKKMKKLSK